MGNTNSGATVAAGTALTADHNWWGAASGPHASTNASGTGNAASANVTFAPYLTSTATVCSGPVASGLYTSPTTAPSYTGFTLNGTLSDATTGNFAIASAQYNINGGLYHTMSAKDGSFNQVAEGVTAHAGGLAPGRYTVCVRGADAAGNAGKSSCFALTVYNAAATQTAAALASATASPTETPGAEQPTVTTVGGSGGSGNSAGNSTPTPSPVGFVGIDGFPNTPCIVGIVALLLILGAILFLVLSRRRRQNEDAVVDRRRGTWER
jgi:hypothetical protein